MTTEEEADRIRDEQREAWRLAGPSWERRREVLAQQSSPVTDRMLALADLQPGQHVIDLACGAGGLSVEIARRVGSRGSVLGLDISDTMVAAARRYAQRERVANVEFRVIERELDLGVEAEAFDCATCRGALMFMPDPTRAMQSLYKALRPDGRVVIATLGSPERCSMLRIPAEVVAQHVDGVAPRAGLPGVFGVPSTAHLTAHFEGAGFVVTHTATLQGPPTEYDSPEQFWDQVTQSAGFLVLLLPSLAQERRDALLATAKEKLTVMFGDSTITLSLEHLIGAGVKPRAS